MTNRGSTRDELARSHSSSDVAGPPVAAGRTTLSRQFRDGWHLASTCTGAKAFGQTMVGRQGASNGGMSIVDIHSVIEILSECARPYERPSGSLEAARFGHLTRRQSSDTANFLLWRTRSSLPCNAGDRSATSSRKPGSRLNGLAPAAFREEIAPVKGHVRARTALTPASCRNSSINGTNGPGFEGPSRHGWPGRSVPSGAAFACSNTELSV